VFGDEIAGLRKALLSDPRLMPSLISDEAHRRSHAAVRNTSRAALRARAADPAAFSVSLEAAFEVDLAGKEAEIARAAELFERTTQFNLSGKRFGTPELTRLARKGALAVGRYADRFGDEGIVAAAVVRKDRILNLAVSCRVAGLGIDRDFLEWLVASPIWQGCELAAGFIATDRNRPICGLLPACGFMRSSGSTWIYSRGGSASRPT
jgi:FkbH-like protein